MLFIFVEKVEVIKFSRHFLYFKQLTQLLTQDQYFIFFSPIREASVSSLSLLTVDHR